MLFIYSLDKLWIFNRMEDLVDSSTYSEYWPLDSDKYLDDYITEEKGEVTFDAYRKFHQDWNGYRLANEFTVCFFREKLDDLFC